MNRKFSFSLLIGIVFLLAGVLFLAYFNSANVMTLVAIVLGVVFVLPSLIYLCLVALRKRGQRDTTDLMGVLPAVGGLCFGVVLILRPQMFDAVLQLVFSTLLIVLGLFHIIYMLVSGKALHARWWWAICPLLVATAGVLTLLVPGLQQNAPLVTLIIGVSFILFAFTEFLVWHGERRALRPAQASATDKPAEPETNNPSDSLGD